MRRQDELLAVYPSGKPLVRKFILAQIEGLALAFDSDELLDFLQAERGSPDPTLRDQAHHTLLGFLPGYIHRRYSLADSLSGIWTDYGRTEARKGPAAAAPDRQQQIQAGLYLATPLADGLLALTRARDGRIAREARLSLANFPLRRINEELWIDAERSPEDFPGFLAAACSTCTAPSRERLVHAVRAFGSRSPSLLLLVSRASPEAGFDLLMDLAPRTDTLGRINLAMALGKMRQVDHALAVQRLMSHREGWVGVFCLGALEAVGDPAHLALIRAVYESTDHPFIKSQAVRAAGGLPSQEALDFCLAALDSPLKEVRAQSLESLVRLRCPIETLRAVAAPLVKSTELRARVNAILACFEPGEASLPAALTELLLSSDTVARLEAAYVLGYLQGGPSRACLITLVSMDPSVTVRVQAIKSLSRYPAEAALETLLPLLGSVEPRISLAAARVLTRYAGEEAALVCEGLMKAGSTALSGFERALVYRSLGTVAGRIGYGPALGLLAEGLDDLDQTARQGAVEGFIAAGRPGLDGVAERLSAIAGGADPRTVPRALLALFTGGELGALERLAARLRLTDDASVLPALETALEASLLLASGRLSERFAGLATAFGALTAADSFRTFAASGGILDRAEPAPEPRKLGGKRLREEGEFPVRRQRPARRQGKGSALPVEPVGPAPVVPVPPQPALDEGVIDRLRDHLGSSEVAAEAAPKRFAARLWEVTYLVSNRLHEPELWRRAAEYRGLLVSSLALAMLVGVIVGAAWNRSRPVEKRHRAPLAVFRIEGTVRATRGTADVSLAPWHPVEPRTRIVTSEGGSVTLVTASGDSVRMEGGASLTVERIEPTGPDLAVALGKGCFVFDWRKAGSIEVEVGASRLRARQAAFTVQPWRDRMTLVVGDGDVEVVESGSSSAVRRGASKTLE